MKKILFCFELIDYLFCVELTSNCFETKCQLLMTLACGEFIEINFSHPKTCDLFPVLVTLPSRLETLDTQTKSSLIWSTGLLCDVPIFRHKLIYTACAVLQSCMPACRLSCMLFLLTFWIYVICRCWCMSHNQCVVFDKVSLSIFTVVLLKLERWSWIMSSLWVDR